MRRGRVPLRRSLIVRLLAASLTIAVTAIVATAWLTFRATTQVIQQERSQSLANHAQIYDSLTGYAATHTSWASAGPLLADLARHTGRRITLTTRDRTVLAESAPGPALHGTAPSATVDPLRLDAGLSGRPDGSIDPRVIGPYALSAKEATVLRDAAERTATCMETYGIRTEISVRASGRPAVETLGAEDAAARAECTLPYLNLAMSSEQRPLADLAEATSTCLGRPGAVRAISPDFTAVLSAGAGPPSDAVEDCVLESRRDQLRRYVAPPALVLVTSLRGEAGGTTIDLSRPSLLRIFGVTGLVLALAVGVTVLVGVRLVRPLQTLTDVVGDPSGRRRRVTVRTHDEIGRLATAFNELSEHREQLERQRKDMVSDVAHELRSPLTNIRSWLEGAQDRVVPLDPQLVDLVLNEAVLLQHVIDDLRDLAAADAGTLRLHPEPTYINDLLAQVVEAHRGSAERAGTLLVSEPADDPLVTVDPNRLRQMVGNLVTNAIRHTPARGRVTIRSGVTADRLTISVIDTGTGIPTADLPRVFDRFWRADASRSRSTGGSGLGLSIVRRLAEAHGGTVSAASEIGVGSTFTLSLPTA
ncbi:HAMP domain-containing histidine kinase [Micromonospora sp. R77]|uniref:sensor histidine kinase n=1 Tax=Micromonospora sp. R77 TaxID=2925836 RepID=UPI001F620142|nr:HAMP domain-containing sensor histidine kinase [Micromonospora sp. R77]MCI4061417.1 HAMP domain-containing histidine kinase [Micromonospora sp. R77]